MMMMTIITHDNADLEGDGHARGGGDDCFTVLFAFYRDRTYELTTPHKDPGHFVPRNAISNMFRPPLHP